MTDPSGPPDTRPPNKPGNPPPPPPKDLAVDLDHAELLLRSVQVLADRLRGMDPALRVQLDTGLRTARRAVAAAKSPSLTRRNGPSPGLAAVAPARGSAGEPPLLGAGFDLPMWPGTAQLAASFARRAD